MSDTKEKMTIASLRGHLAYIKGHQPQACPKLQKLNVASEQRNIRQCLMYIRILFYSVIIKRTYLLDLKSD